MKVSNFISVDFYQADLILLRTVVSGGFDQTLNHHHYLYKTLLSSSSITSVPLTNPDSSTEEPNLFLSPSFIHCAAISEKSVIACGTADGRLILGFGAVAAGIGKRGQTKKKWEGLRKEDMRAVKVADGPVVGL